MGIVRFMVCEGGLNCSVVVLLTTTDGVLINRLALIMKNIFLQILYSIPIPKFNAID